MCEKRGYPSVASARKANRRMGNTIRAYLCGECHKYHVTKDRRGSGRL